MKLSIPTLKIFSCTLDSLRDNLSKSGRSRKQAVSVLVDSLLVVLSLWAAYSLRHGMRFSDFQSTWYLFVLMPIGTVVVFMSLGIYRWVIRSSDEHLFRQLAKAAIAASVLLIIVSFLLPPDRTNARSLFVIFGMLLFISTSLARYIWLKMFNYGNRGEPIAIYGAGDAGRQLLHSLTNSSEYRPVLFLDDNPSIAGSTINGLPVVSGNADYTHRYLHGAEVERVIMALPSLGAAEYQKKFNSISNSGIAVQTVPTHAELVSGAIELAQVRDISISDILGRSEVPPNVELLGKRVHGLSVLVTGGGGSIGSELCRQILAQNPKQLIVLDHSEENLYLLTEEIRQTLGQDQSCSITFVPYLGSVTDNNVMTDIVVRHNIQTIFHAAAYKHVPIIEAVPDQGVRVNVFGTLNVLDIAISAGVENFILISTDKAVRPTNGMGATKRIAELILQAKARERGVGTRISMVRFGNVLGSSGSVVPKFKKQIEANGPITLTDPNITRYFMTIPEAAQLVLQAGAIATGGEVFVLDMGEPVRIEDLAIAMIKLSGKNLRRETGKDSDIDIVVEGLRPGEKMFEELFLSDDSRKTVVTKVFTADEAWLAWNELEIRLKQIEAAALPGRRKELRAMLLDLAFLRNVKSCNVPKTGQASNDQIIKDTPAIKSVS